MHPLSHPRASTVARLEDALGVGLLFAFSSNIGVEPSAAAAALGLNYAVGVTEDDRSEDARRLIAEDGLYPGSCIWTIVLLRSNLNGFASAAVGCSGNSGRSGGARTGRVGDSSA